ncbi:Riboflavin synthase-like beta-barrel [Penicillium fimorum]|uniref:Riboflavin synthase-like beta-barrel n=1 Tax=Penicillium fimorum TaxID=1882269 RepID=A0A9W9XWS7_9EURO|nr:Riboflavin synthase-like beta-barrel [Penicillium fimorum]
MKFQSLYSVALRSTIPLRILRPQLGFRSISRTTGQMTSQREDSIPHELRTAAEPRQNRLHPVRLSHIEQINPSVRLLQFALPQENNDTDQQPFSFFPGQWLDVHIPSITQAGGFTITSTPADAQVLPPPEASIDSLAGETLEPSSESQGRPPYVELAVQNSPGNPSAAWLWRPKEDILGRELNIRVGGSFVWPPTGVGINDVKNVVFVAGGVGINPLISILSHLNNNEPHTPNPTTIHVLYSSRLPQDQEKASTDAVLDQILFLPRLRQIVRSQESSHRLRISLDLFLTDLASSPNLFSSGYPSDLKIHPVRISDRDLRSAAVGTDGELDSRGTVCYVCGPPGMTDSIVEKLVGMLGDGGEQRVFFEKWW